MRPERCGASKSLARKRSSANGSALSQYTATIFRQFNTTSVGGIGHCQPTNPSKKLSRYKWVDSFGPWRDRDISWPGGGGPRYDVIHPKTGLACKVPEAGWRFSTPEEMDRQIRTGLVEFRADHSEPPFRKAHLLPTPDELASETDQEEAQEDEAGMSVMLASSISRRRFRWSTARKIFDGQKVFDNPKDHEVIMRLIRYVTNPGDLVLDSFAGTGTTGHAVLALNREVPDS